VVSPPLLLLLHDFSGSDAASPPPELGPYKDSQFAIPDTSCVLATCVTSYTYIARFDGREHDDGVWSWMVNYAPFVRSVGEKGGIGGAVRRVQHDD